MLRLTLPLCAAAAVPFGEHAPDAYKGTIKTFAEGEFPTTADFYSKYANSWGQPLLFKGAAKHMAGMKWTDDVLIAKAGAHPIDVEFAKKETRRAEVNRLPFAQFLSRYNTSDIYSVTDVPPPMMPDVELLPFLGCAGYTKLLDVATMWMSSGGTYSVLHNDDQDNINCLFAGSKRMVFWHPARRDLIQSKAYGWHNYNEEPLHDGGYGSFAKWLDVKDVDLAKYPGWAKLPWWDGDMETGDCLYIPHKWYHTVASKDRNIAVNVWWWRNDANGGNVRGDVAKKPNAPFAGEQGPCEAGPFSLAECEWGFEHTHGGKGAWKQTRAKEFTHCKKGGRGGSIKLQGGGEGGGEAGEEGGEEDLEEEGGREENDEETRDAGDDHDEL